MSSDLSNFKFVAMTIRCGSSKGLFTWSDECNAWSGLYAAQQRINRLWQGFNTFFMHGKFKVNVIFNRLVLFLDIGPKIISYSVKSTFYHWLQEGLTLLQSLHRLSNNCHGIEWLYRLSFITLLSHFGSFGVWLRSYTVRGQSAFIFSDYAIRDGSMSI